MDGLHGAGDSARECRRNHYRHCRSGRHIRLHPAAHRRRNGVRGTHDGAQHADPASRCPCPAAVRQARGSGVPRIDGVEYDHQDRPPDDRADDRQPTRRRDRARRCTPRRARRVCAGRGVPDDRAPRVLCADPTARRRFGHLHRPRPAEEGGRRRCLDRYAHHSGDERARPPRHRGYDRRDRADGHAGVRYEAHAGRHRARRGRRRARGRRPACRIGAAELQPAPLHRIGRRRNRIAGGRTARHRSGRRPLPQRHEGIRDQRDPLRRHRQPCPQSTGTRARRDRRRGRWVRVADARQRRPPRSRSVVGCGQRDVVARRHVLCEYATACACRAHTRDSGRLRPSA